MNADESRAIERMVDVLLDDGETNQSDYEWAVTKAGALLDASGLLDDEWRERAERAEARVAELETSLKGTEKAAYHFERDWRRVKADRDAALDLLRDAGEVLAELHKALPDDGAADGLAPSWWELGVRSNGIQAAIANLLARVDSGEPK
jgi:hypothetical protein